MSMRSGVRAVLFGREEERCKRPARWRLADARLETGLAALALDTGSLTLA
ncbi:MAG: hypothetical protein KY466_16820 [Gemmatimonadetes bacterium]|nr:hypothetical protein [Gemmatimonadota bacterium]